MSLYIPLKGYYPSTKHWIYEMGQYQLIKPLYPEETLQLPEPKGLDLSIDWDSILLDQIIPDQFLVNIPYGRFIGGERGGAVITFTNKMLLDVSNEYFQYENFVNKLTGPMGYLPNTVAVLQSYLGNNYFHFMFDVAARIHLLQISGIPISKYITTSTQPYQDELLNLLGIPKTKRIECNERLHVRAKEMLVPSYTGSHRGLIPRWACNYLREQLLENRKVDILPEYRRIYISRCLANHRKIVNEMEVLYLLAFYGFKPVFLELESVERKIEIFHSAEVIVAPHGAGLTNLIFCKPGTKVIEIFNPNWMLPSFWIMSYYMNLDYYFLLGKGQRLSTRMNLDNIHDDIIVDLHELRATLNMASISVEEG